MVCYSLINAVAGTYECSYSHMHMQALPLINNSTQTHKSIYYLWVRVLYRTYGNRSDLSIRVEWYQNAHCIIVPAAVWQTCAHVYHTPCLINAMKAAMVSLLWSLSVTSFSAMAACDWRWTLCSLSHNNYSHWEYNTGTLLPMLFSLYTIICK